MPPDTLCIPCATTQVVTRAAPSKVSSSLGPRRWLLVAVAVVSCGLLDARVAIAQAQDLSASASAPLRAVLWLQPGTDDVFERIRGQTNDLHVDLQVDTLRPTPSESGAQVQAAYALGAEYDAALVIWFVKQLDAPQHFIVNIALPKTQRLLSRDLGPSNPEANGTELSSVVKESAALVVRAAIQAVQSGMTIGEVHAALAADTAHAEIREAPAPQQRNIPTTSPGPWHDATQPTQAAPAPPERHSQPWALGADWLWVYDGPKGGSLAECGELRVDRRERSFWAFARAGACINRNIDSGPQYAFGQFRLGRQHALLGGSLLFGGSGLQVSLGAHAGAVFYERSTVSPSPAGVSAKAPTFHALGVLGPEFRLLVPGQGSRIQAGFELGLDLLTNSMNIGYQTSDALVSVAKVRAIQPYAALGLTLAL